MATKAADLEVLDALEQDDPKWKRRIEKGLAREAGITIKIGKPLGRGMFGHAFSTSNPDLVLKLSKDLNEGHFSEEVRIKQEWDDNHEVRDIFRRGCIRVFFVGLYRKLMLNTAVYKEPSPVYVILREYVGMDIDNATKRSFDERSREISRVIRGSVTSVSSPKSRTARTTVDLPAYEQYVRNQAAYDSTLNKIRLIAPNIAEVMQYYLDHMRVITDLHGNNIGVRVVPGMVSDSDQDLGVGDLILADLGMTRPISAHKLTRINPSAMSYFARAREAELADRCRTW